MARDLGTKHTCFKCQTKFYDLKKPAPVCPKCGTDQREMPVTTKADRRRAAAKAEKVEEEVVDETTEESEDEDDDEDDA